MEKHQTKTNEKFAPLILQRIFFYYMVRYQTNHESGHFQNTNYPKGTVPLIIS